MKKLSTILCVGWLLVFVPSSFSNNISVSNVSLEGQVVVDHYCLIEFDLSWDNSWRTTSIPQNWDAAWVFAKYSVAGGPWLHAKIDPAGSVQPAGCDLEFADTTGVFIYRDTDGSGTFSISDIGLRWSYGDQGVNDDASVEVKVFAIEMVYVPQGSFYLGDGSSNHRFHKSMLPSEPYEVTSAPIHVHHATENYLYADGSVGAGINGSTIPADYPTGYNAFYCMKYEISQEQYVDFLNCLNRIQQDANTTASLAGTYVTNNFVLANMPESSWSYNNGIWCYNTVSTTDTVMFYNNLRNTNIPNDIDDAHNDACNFLTWMNLAAYADWAGLRPMSEPEYEKACRGANYPVSGEFAWGNATLSVGAYGIFLSNQPNSLFFTEMDTVSGNALYSLTVGTGEIGPVRCGIFAASDTKHTRVTTGATYYGIMEMSGNVREMIVAMFNQAGASYTGLHGDGFLTADGHANTDYWPGIGGNIDWNTPTGVFTGIGVTTAPGAGVKGGYWNQLDFLMQTSNRQAASQYTIIESSHNGTGGRLVRTAP